MSTLFPLFLTMWNSTFALQLYDQQTQQISSLSPTSRPLSTSGLICFSISLLLVKCFDLSLVYRSLGSLASLSPLQHSLKNSTLPFLCSFDLVLDWFLSLDNSSINLILAVMLKLYYVANTSVKYSVSNAKLGIQHQDLTNFKLISNWSHQFCVFAREASPSSPRRSNLLMYIRYLTKKKYHSSSNCMTIFNIFWV